MMRNGLRGLFAAAFATAAIVIGLAGITAERPPEEPLRPQVHFTPPRYFMNDPNGLVFFKGEYHLFYQHNPLGETWGHMSWGHAVSPDMLHWQHLPIALREEDGVMVFSGSAVVDAQNSSGLCRGDDAPACLIAIYTGHGLGKQTQNIAVSNDRGRTWTKYVGNPVIDLSLKEFRDPKVLWHEPTRRWIMVTVLADQHKVRLFGSRNLTAWETLSDFGPAGATGGAWECPDLFELPVDEAVGQRRWVLVVNINPGGVAGGSGTQYFVGTFDGAKFTNENTETTTLWADYGKDFYASQSFSDIPPRDGRRIWMGWISNWQYANEEPTVRWRGGQSIPRTLGLRRLPEGIRLIQSPVSELTMLRSGNAVHVGVGTMLPSSADIEFRVSRADKPAGLRLFNSAGEELTVGVTGTRPEVFVDRRNSSKAPAFHKEFPGRHSTPVRWKAIAMPIRVLFDRSVVEVFAGNGEAVLTDRVYPTQPLDRVELLPDTRDAGGSAVFWELRRSMP